MVKYSGLNEKLLFSSSVYYPVLKAVNRKLFIPYRKENVDFSFLFSGEFIPFVEREICVGVLDSE